MKNFESKFREWFDLVSGHDPQHYQDLEWEWEDEIYNFLKNPDKCLRKEIKWKKLHDAYMQKSMEEDIKSGAFKPFEEIKLPIGEKHPNISPVDERTDSNQGRSDTGVTEKNKKIKDTEEYFTNVFGIRMKRQKETK